MRREPFAGGVVGAFGLALGLGVSGAPGDGRHSQRRQVELGAGGQAPAVGVEGRPVVGQDRYGPPVSGDGPGQDVNGVGGVGRPRPSGQGDAQPGGVVDDLVDGGPVPAGQGHFEGVQLPQFAGPGSGEAGVGRAGTLGPLDAGGAVAGQDPVDGGDAGQGVHPLLLEVEADGDAARIQAPAGQFGVQGRHGRLHVGPVAAAGAPGRA